jgi:hypothetical protein
MLAGASVVPAEAQRAQARPAPKAEAPAPIEMTMAGIRVVREGMGEGGSELRAFNWSSGTDLEVFVRLGRANEFFVEVDDDESIVENFSDDVGGGLAQGAEVDSFPKVSADGTAALVTLSSDAVPGPGATAVTVSGQLAITTSSGSKVQKIPNVKIESAKTFKIGTAVVTIEEVSSDAERTTFGLAMSRATRNLIKSLTFKNAKGEVLDVSQNGYSIMNDAAVLNYSGPGGLTGATIEADIWQNLKSRKAPFKITATLGGEK